MLEDTHRKEVAEGTFDVEGALARGWSGLDDEGKGEFHRKFEQMKRAADVEKEVGVGGGGALQTVFDGERRHLDEDVEMAEEEEDAGTPGDVGGFTAVNRD